MHDTQAEIDPETRAQAEAVRRACVDVALSAWEDAGISGLCAEGRWEMVVQTLRDFDLTPVLNETADRG